MAEIWTELKEDIIEQIRAYDPEDDKPNIPLKYKNIVADIIHCWFENKAYDNNIPVISKSIADKKEADAYTLGCQNAKKRFIKKLAGFKEIE